MKLQQLQEVTYSTGNKYVDWVTDNTKRLIQIGSHDLEKELHANLRLTQSEFKQAAKQLLSHFGEVPITGEEGGLFYSWSIEIEQSNESFHLYLTLQDMSNSGWEKIEDDEDYLLLITIQ